jgi:phosphonoacetaldehyde hydrolase
MSSRALQARGVKIGSCTGYSRDMMDEILPLARAQGYAPDCVVCAGETPAGRPSPLMVWKNLVELGVWPADACVKVDDTEVGIAEGRAAGVWTVGVARTGNIVGLSKLDLAALSQTEREARVAHARERLAAAGAHLVIDTVGELPQILRDLPSRG